MKDFEMGVYCLHVYKIQLRMFVSAELDFIWTMLRIDRSFDHRRGPVAVAVGRALGVGQDPVLPVGHPGVHSCTQVLSI